MERARQSLLFTAGILALVASAEAQASDSQSWVSGTATFKLSNQWSVSQDLTARFSDNRHGLYELEMNSLVGFQLSKSLAFWAGYDHDPQYSGGRFTVMEHRLPQIVTFNNFTRLGSGHLTGRLRLEERWRDGRSGTGWRLRPYLRYSLPIDKKSNTALTISEEPFFALNRTSFQTVAGLERLRSLVAITTPIGKKLSADIGYMNQHGFVPQKKDTSDNIAYFSVGIKL